MDDIAQGIDPDDLMDLDDAEGSDLDEEEDELIDDPLPSPFQFPSSGSAATSAASSPPNTDDFPLPFGFSGKPFSSIKRGRGRPRREGGERHLDSRKKFKNMDRMDFDMSSITPSLGDEMPLVDPETGALIFTEREKPTPVFEELPYFPEQFPGKVCAFCNLGERSQLGQGEMLRLICPEGFIPQRIVSGSIENLHSSVQTPFNGW